MEGSWTGLEELDWGWAELPCSQAALPPLISLGLHCCLIFKYRSILCNICHKFTFQSDLLSGNSDGFYVFSTPLPGSLSCL